MTTERIDVLAVMQRIGDASASRRLNYEERDDLWVARAAVAELIDAFSAYGNDMSYANYKRLREALVAAGAP